MGLDKTGKQGWYERSSWSIVWSSSRWQWGLHHNFGIDFFFTPSDSLTIIATYSNVIPFFWAHGGLKDVSPAMSTSGAVDLVAKNLGFDLFEKLTGWRCFEKFVDSKLLYNGKDYTYFVCGEESIGTGSNHSREKEEFGLCWLG